MKPSKLVFFVNGKKVEDEDVDPDWTLLRYLREKLRLPGTKMGCSEGGCGACTVMVSKMERKTGNVKHLSVNACLAPVCSLHGASVTTTEGIGSTDTRLHPVQERLSSSHGSQCGFCTPGFVMSMYTVLRNNPNPTMEEIEDALVGNLCRCTGYRPILEGFRSFTETASLANDCARLANGCGKKDCCQLNGSSNPPAQNGFQEEMPMERTAVLVDPSLFTPYDPTQEVIFPPELKLNPSLSSSSLCFRGPRTTFFRPASLAELLSLKERFPDAKIVVGNTEVGVEVKMKSQHYPVIIHPSDIPELLQVKADTCCVEVGACVTLTDIEVAFKGLVNSLQAHKTKILSSILEMLKWFAGRQIRNVAAIGGNIMTGSPISDLNPIFMAAGATLVFQSTDGEREVSFDDKFYTSYRRNIAKPNEVLISVKIPLTSEHEHFKAYKQARRRDDDIAIANCAIKVDFKPGSLEVSSATLAFGGMAPTTILAKNTSQSLRGQTWTKELLENATLSLLEELKLHPGAPGGMVDYRTALTASFFFKFYLHVCQELHRQYPGTVSALEKDEADLIKPYEHVTSKSTQFCQNVSPSQERIDPIGRPIRHVSSTKQVSGEATFIDDLPGVAGELHAALVLSSRPHALVVGVDEAEALDQGGVVAFFGAKDVPGVNKFGPEPWNQEVFASKQVHCVGQVIGIVVAKDQELARRAAKMVKITYEDLKDPIFSIKEAIEANSMWAPICAEDGNIEEGFKKSDCVLEGESYMGGQEHFYLETNVHIAIPHEGKQMELISSTQNVTGTQQGVALALGVPWHLVTCKVRRIGGGFGGKETVTNAISVPVAVAASILKRSVRLVMDRDEDMLVTGGRHPYLGRWRVGFNKDGSIVALELTFYSNAGYSLDLSGGVMFRAVFSADNAYKIPNMKVTGYNCRTNLPSNTAFRGFGSPQACFIMEDIVEKVSEYLQQHPMKVREKNFLKSNETLFHGQNIGTCCIQKCWDQLLHSTEYNNREKAINDFNRTNRYKKRGISITPSKFGIAYGLQSLNQSGALVLVYMDGSVLVSHGGMEMGQGLHTKMIQVTAKALTLPMDKIFIAETSTDKVPNSSPTAASYSSDLNGMAIMEACNKLLRRLEPYKKKMPEKEWDDWVMAAYRDRVSLSATGFYKTPNLVAYSQETKSGSPFHYFVYGASMSEVEIDCLTGDHTVLRQDIVMDVGNPLNPAIDIGQVEGAFMQGYGLFTMEQLVYSPSGQLLTKGPGAYKIPSVQDIPREFNVSLLRSPSLSPQPLFSSKAVGEPPLFAGASVFFAIRKAVKAARSDKESEMFEFVSPATAERIRMACQDHITDQIKPAEKGSFRPWALDNI